MRIGQLLLAGAVVALVPSSTMFDRPAWAQSATSGSVRGIVKDKATHDAAVGATIVATSPARVGEQVVITDENGAYFISSLPPGTYTLTIFYENRVFSRPNVLVQVGKEAVVNILVNPKAGKRNAGSEVIEIRGSADARKMRRP
jgi:hypothetical protein